MIDQGAKWLAAHPSPIINPRIQVQDPSFGGGYVNGGLAPVGTYDHTQGADNSNAVQGNINGGLAGLWPQISQLESRDLLGLKD